DDGYSLKSNGDLAAQLKEAVGRLPECVAATLPDAAAEEKVVSDFTPPPPLKHIAEGSFFVRDDGAVCQVEGGEGHPLTYGGTDLPPHGTMPGKRLAALVRLRAHARGVLQSQNEGWPESSRAAARRELNWAYDRFASAYGPINKTTFHE